MEIKSLLKESISLIECKHARSYISKTFKEEEELHSFSTLRFSWD